MPMGFLIALQAVLMLALGAGVCLAGGSGLPAVPKGHPRVYVRADDLPHLREKLASPEFAPVWEEVQKAAGKSPSCAAFVHLVTGDKAAGRAAIAGALKALKESDDARTFGMPMHWGACVYDWCYDLLTPEEKAAFVTEFQRIANLHGPYYPAKMDTMAVVGHDTEGWLLTGQLPAGVAIYDESPQMYDAAVRLFEEKFVPVRNSYYPSHWHHQGDSYLSRFEHDLAASWLFRRMGDGDVLSREQRFVPYQFIYNLRPDGQQMRSGDTYDDAGKSESKRAIAMLAGAYYNDPYLLTLADSDLFWNSREFTRVLELLFREPGAAKKPLGELPLTQYFMDPAGEMVARTGWTLGKDSPDAVVQMRVGGLFFGNHQRRDFGTFQIYYRGGLAISSGVYEGNDSPYGSEHWGGYYHQTLAHNGLLVYDPNETGWGYVRPVNDGGQRVPNNNADHPVDLDMLLSKDYRMGRVTASAIGPASEYSYLAGDITQAYTNKVKSVTRAMVTLNLGDPTYPAALVVYDRVVAAEPEFKKTWLLHSIQEPKLEGRTITVLRDRDGYHGKLVAESLLPEQATLRAIGGPGKEFWVESAGKNFATEKKAPAEPGAWRVEVSPARPAAEDRFLHVLTVMDAATPRGPAVARADGDGLVGARVLDRVVLFSANGKLLTKAGFAVDAQAKVLVCDLEPGRWLVMKDGQPQGGKLAVGAEGQCLYLTAAPGRYVLRRTDSSKEVHVKSVDAIGKVIAKANAEGIRSNLFHLAKDPLPFRKVNYTRPGQTKTSLEEADDFLEATLRGWGYGVEKEGAQVQAFRCDKTKHPSHWYSVPDPSDPKYTAYNLYAKKTGTEHPEQIIIVISHKDSPSWIDCPGANDNAAGTSCNLEVARLLAKQPTRKSVWFIYCNEEHYPWTSITAANNAKARGDDLIAVFNLDGSGGKSPEDKAKGRHPSSAIYGTPEGEALADLLIAVNQAYAIGLDEYKRFRAEPGNDDGSFLKAGFPAAIGCHGDLDWADAAYHRPEDIPERLDPEAIRRVAQMIAAGVLTLDAQ